jgi:hypothetical protein
MFRRSYGLAFAGVLLFGAVPSAYAEEPVASDAGLVASGGTDVGECGPTCVPRWDAMLGFVYLQRPGTQLPRVANQVGGPIDYWQPGFDFQGGPDLTILRHGDRADLEFRWFQVHGATSFAGSTYQSPPNEVGFDGIGISARYLSNLDSFELNVKRPVNDWLTVFGGFRFIEFNETTVFTVSDGGDDTASLFVRNFNDLYGFQIGSDITVWDRGGPFRVLATGKAGIYGDCARGRVDDGEQQPRTLGSPLRWNTAFVGEMGLVGAYQITPRLTARLGYELLWLNGMTLVPEKVLQPNPGNEAGAFAEPNVATTGTVFYHGVMAGVDFRF